MEFILKLFLFLFLLGIFTYYGRYAKSSVFERPLILNSVFFQTIYGFLTIVTLIYAGFLLFTDWRIFLVGLIIHLIFRNKIEDVANIPLVWIASKLRDKE